MADFEDEIKEAVAHAGAVVLLWVKAAERGYTSLVAHGPLVQQGVELANSQAMARGVPADQINISAPQVLQAAQEMGAAGVDPALVAEETKAPGSDETTDPAPAADVEDAGDPEEKEKPPAA
jgi:hypothetical protein